MKCEDGLDVTTLKTQNWLNILRWESGNQLRCNYSHGYLVSERERCLCNDKTEFEKIDV